MDGGNRTTEEIIAAGKYDWKSSRVNGKNFPMRRIPEGPREIVLLEFDRKPANDEVLVKARRQGLERPRYEDALLFGEQYPEEQRKASIVFLHEPWKCFFCEQHVLVLNCDNGRRGLCMRYFGYRWGRRCRFAFVRK